MAAFNWERLKKMSLGIHVRKVSEKGKVPCCQYCSGNIEYRGEWHMVKVMESTTNQQWGKNELHFHFKCAKQGLDESKRAVDQLLSIVRSENDIGPDEKRSFIMSIEKGE